MPDKAENSTLCSKDEWGDLNSAGIEAMIALENRVAELECALREISAYPVPSAVRMIIDGML